jgi:hypothetical protein
MTCLTILDRMLEAELDELDGRGDSALAGHIRECARCRAVAKQLRLNTARLGDVIQQARPSRPSVRAARRAGGRRAGRVGVLGVAAALTLMAVRAWHKTGTPSAASVERTPTTIYAAVDTADTASASRHTAGERQDGSRVASASRPTTPGRRVSGSSVTTTTTPPPVRVVPVSLRPLTPVAAVEAVRLDVTPAAPPLGSEVQADPPPGRRATIMRTPSPSVTVVWLSESPSPGTQP